MIFEISWQGLGEFLQIQIFFMHALGQLGGGLVAFLMDGLGRSCLYLRKDSQEGRQAGKKGQGGRQTGREVDRQRQRPTQERSNGCIESQSRRIYMADWGQIAEKAAEPGKTAKDFFYQGERRQD